MKDVLYWPHKYTLEKNQVPREFALIALSLAYLWLNETHMVEAKNKYHTFYPSWDGPSEAKDMNGRFQMQGGKNWILPK